MNLENPIEATDHIASNYKYKKLNDVKLKLKDSFK